MHYLFLILGILSELFGSTLLKFSDGFRKKVLAAFCLLFYFLAYYLVAVSMRVLPLNIAYATWCAAGTVCTVFIGQILFGEKHTARGYVGLALLISGMVALNLLS